jgi:hypothetical protein
MEALSCIKDRERCWVLGAGFCPLPYDAFVNNLEKDKSPILKYPDECWF